MLGLSRISMNAVGQLYLRELELRQYKNGFFSVKRMLGLKLPPFFPCRVGEGKRTPITKQTCFSQKRVRSYIVLALMHLQYRYLSQVLSEKLRQRNAYSINAKN